MKNPRTSPRAEARHAFDCGQIGKAGWLVGIDEVGYGAWAGPLVAAAVALPQSFLQNDTYRKQSAHWRDSKKLSPIQRADIFRQLQELAADNALRSGVGIVSIVEIIAINHMGEANRLAMARAFTNLENPWEKEPGSTGKSPPLPCDTDFRVLIDGRPQPKLPFAHTAVVKGDDTSLAIAAAANLAKVTRDRLMETFDSVHPGYHFASNKGYPAPAHLAGLRLQGPCPLHRPAYLRKMLAREQQPELPLTT
jgi:ribonuclease HII